MKKLEVTISAFKLDEVRDGLVTFGIDGMTVTEVKAMGPRVRHAYHRGAEYDIPFQPELKLEIVLTDDLVGGCIEVVRRCTQSDPRADGMIVVVPLDDAVAIRTGEHLVRAA